MAKKAIVLAAGFGKRLRPFTAAVPKPLLPVWGEPMLARVVAWLRARGVEDIVVNCHHLHGQIEEWCRANGCRASFEPEILGTGGVLNPLRDWIGGDDFWLVNGDIVFETPQDAGLPEGKFEPGAPGTATIGECIVCTEGPRTIEVEPGAGLVTCWHSPDPGWEGTWTYCGIALLKAKILDYVGREGFSSIVDAYEAAMMDGNFIKAFTPPGMLWTDAGTVESYIALNEDGEDNAFAAIPQLAAAGASMEDAAPPRFLGARGSERAFFRFADRYAIIYDDETRVENARYAEHARWLKERGISVPEVLADAPKLKTLALANAGSEDLGARGKRRGEERLRDYVAVVEELAKFNLLGAEGAKDAPPPLEGAFDASLYAWEHDLFEKHCLRERFGMDMPRGVARELESVAEKLLAEPRALVHRDFQSTNVLWKNERFSFIDFQGMRYGAGVYDLASLLFDPYVPPFSDSQRKALAALWAKKCSRDPAEVVAVLPFAAVQRLSQTLGAFGRLAALGNTEFQRHTLQGLENLLAAADEAGLDETGALAEELIAREAKKTAHGGAAHGDGCACGHHHHHHHHESDEVQG